MRLAFGCPYYGNTPPRVTISQNSAVMHVAWKHPWVANVCTERTPHITACERILERAVANEKVDALFWTEHDCVLPQDAVTRLVDLLEQHPEADIATGITFMRYWPYHPMIALHAGVLTQEVLDQERPVIVVNKGAEPIVGKEHFKFITTIDTGAVPYPVDATSLNCVLFRRSALEMMAALDRPFDVGHFTTPDFALFARLRGKALTLVDPSLLTLHLGEQEAIGFDQWVGAMEKLVAQGNAERLAEPSLDMAQAERSL